MTIEEAKSYAQKRFTLNSPLTEQTIVAFEQTYSVSLPNEYRAFMLYVGNGGSQAGRPFFRLGVGGEYARVLPLLNKPFPHIKAWNDFPDNDYYDDSHIQGALPFFHEGCGYHYFVVVTGTERGNIWIDARVSDGGILPITNNQSGQSVTFFQWFKWWDELLSKHK